MSTPANTDTTPTITEHPAPAANGYPIILGIAAIIIAAVIAIHHALLTTHHPHHSTPTIEWIGTIIAILLAIPTAFAMCGIRTVNPGEAVIVRFLGRYLGTIRRTGLVATIPFSTLTRMSVRVNSFETDTLKVNDANGTPIDVKAVVVWQVEDTAKAKFAVENYEAFIKTQAEAALRHVAMSHPYDDPANDPDTATGPVVTLRSDTDTIIKELAAEVSARAELAGVKVIEVRIANLSYAPEIAGAMLRRQQASAVLAAKEVIVNGATGMARDAITQLEKDDTIDLDPERRAAIISNLLVVLCSDTQAQPIVNTGSLY